MNLSIEIPPLDTDWMTLARPSPIEDLESAPVTPISQPSIDGNLRLIKYFLLGFRSLVAITQTLKWKQVRPGFYQLDRSTVLGQYADNQNAFMCALLIASGLIPQTFYEDPLQAVQGSSFWLAQSEFLLLDNLRGAYKLIQTAWRSWLLLQYNGPNLEVRYSRVLEELDTAWGFSEESLMAIPPSYRINFAVLPRNIGNLLYDSVHTNQMKSIRTDSVRNRPRFVGLRPELQEN